VHVGVTLNAKCSVVEKFRVFRALGGNRETFMPENGLILLNFKQLKCNTAKLFRWNTNVHAIRETFPPRNILRLRYVSKHLKEHSTVVVKKEFQLRKAFNFFKNVY